jgi:hypothetical protein
MPPGRGAGPAVRLAFACCAAALSALAVLSGCNQATRAKTPDPLYGESLDKPSVPGPPAPMPPKKTSGTAPAAVPLPAATSTTSPAAIAIGDPILGSTPPALQGGRPLVIGNGPAPSGSPPGGTLTSGAPGVPTNPKLRPPEMLVPVPTVPPQGGVAPASAVSPTPVPAWQARGSALGCDDLERRLKERKASWRAESVPGGVKFSCRVPNPSRPDFMRFYEATRAELQSAALAVLEQIDRVP